MCVHWYFAEHFSELSYRSFSKSNGRILDELRVSFKVLLKQTKMIIILKIK